MKPPRGDPPEGRADSWITAAVLSADCSAVTFAEQMDSMRVPTGSVSVDCGDVAFDALKDPMLVDFRREYEPMLSMVDFRSA